MNLIDFKWNKKTYREFIQYLYSIQDIKYKEFHSKIAVTNNLIGIRSKEIKQLSKEISKGDYLNFIKYNEHNLYEEVMIHGLLLGYLKIPFQEILILLEEYIPYISSWAEVDGTVANLKIFKKNEEAGFKFSLELIQNENPWSKRVGIVLLMSYYLNELYIDTILNTIDSINSDEYYVKMAIAWLISVAYVKQRNKTHTYLLRNNLDKWTHNKAIQKIKESFRVGKEDKDILVTLKR